MISRFGLHFQVPQYAAHFALRFLVLRQNYYHKKGFIIELAICLFTVCFVSEFLKCFAIFSACASKTWKFFTPSEWAAQVNLCETGAVWQSLCLRTGPLLQLDLGSRANSGDLQNKIISLWGIQTKFGGGENYQGNWAWDCPKNQILENSCFQTASHGGEDSLLKCITDC